MVSDSCRFFALILECTKNMEFSACLLNSLRYVVFRRGSDSLAQCESETLQHPVLIQRDFLRFWPVARIQKENAYFEQGPKCVVLPSLDQLNRPRCGDTSRSCGCRLEKLFGQILGQIA